MTDTTASQSSPEQAAQNDALREAMCEAACEAMNALGIDASFTFADAQTVVEAALAATPPAPVEGVEQLRIGEAVEVVTENLPEQWRGGWENAGTFYVARIEASGDSLSYTISDTWPIKRGFHGASELTDGFEPGQLRAAASPAPEQSVSGLAAELLDEITPGNAPRVTIRRDLAERIIAALAIAPVTADGLTRESGDD